MPSTPTCIQCEANKYRNSALHTKNPILSLQINHRNCVSCRSLKMPEIQQTTINSLWTIAKLSNDSEQRLLFRRWRWTQLQVAGTERMVVGHTHTHIYISINEIKAAFTLPAMVNVSRPRWHFLCAAQLSPTDVVGVRVLTAAATTAAAAATVVIDLCSITNTFAFGKCMNMFAANAATYAHSTFIYVNMSDNMSQPHPPATHEWKSLFVS